MPKAKAQDSSTTVQPVVVAHENATTQDRNLFIKVVTRDGKDHNKVIGERIVDLYHFGTRKWIHNHTWWATHNGHVLSIDVASPVDVDAYLADAKNKLAEKFNSTSHSASPKAA